MTEPQRDGGTACRDGEGFSSPLTRFAGAPPEGEPFVNRRITPYGSPCNAGFHCARSAPSLLFADILRIFAYIYKEKMKKLKKRGCIVEKSVIYYATVEYNEVWSGLSQDPLLIFGNR